LCNPFIIKLEGFISYARKPQAFKPGDEWHPFEASQVKPGEAEQFPA
jgi:hypothetical protein